MRPISIRFCGLLVALLGGLAAEPGNAQTEYGSRLGVQYGTETSYAPQGPGVMLGVLEPAKRRWYVPQELYKEYQWRQWEYTNYARQPYQRYVETSLEGDYFYDLYGNFVTRGWLIFNNAQNRPQQFGNTLFKSDRFSQWFSDVVVAADQQGQYYYSLTVSSQLRSVLSPMIFSKPRFDGVQFDLSTDRYEATLIYSRISSSGGSGTNELEVPRTNNTTLLGGRLGFQLGEFAELGFHTINAHQSNTLSDKLAGNPFAGALTVGQNKTVSFVQLVLRDDSPEDGIGGAAFFPAGSDVLITYRDGETDSGKDIRFEPVVEGGFVEQGFLAANGTEEIRLLYDFNSPAFVDRASQPKEEIIKVEFRLSVGNDYQIWMTSDQQTNRDGQPILLLVSQAEGNVKDITNLQTLSFDYGLPTATHIFGTTLEVRDLKGFDFYGEYDLNWNYRKYPNPGRETHKTSSGTSALRRAPAWMVNISRKAAPWFLFGEAYSMDPHYNTRTFISQGAGGIEYDSERRGIVELVDDNDDHDRFPDTVRFDWLPGDSQVFPGWDQNNDFVPDINQNDNSVRSNTTPDYDEAFLRYNSDRPEFLFGSDMNNNFWVDQFENDELPDYPYGKDHQGLNIYGGADVVPGLRVTVGLLREQLISSDQENNSLYGMMTFDMDSPRYGRLRIFQTNKKVEDDIPDDLLQWAPDNTLLGGELTKVEDPLLARDTFINQSFVGHRLRWGGFSLSSKANYVLFNQLMDKEKRAEFNLDKRDFFFGAINKLSYRQQVGRFVLEPRWKSEFRKQSRGLFTLESQTTLSELFSALIETSLLRVTGLQAGIEYLIHNDMDEDLNDFNSVTGAIQFNNESAYLGYRLRALAGFSLERKDFKGLKSRTTSQSFITIYAGLN
ncbi:MAG: hypothetical protein GKR89_18815 [Candidatus Latescibacteria bacterium]|nr:hypothetical protein [Candidatus Latescibacterota bacterium]